MIKLESSKKIEQYKKDLLNKKSFEIHEAIETFYSIFNNIKEFELEAKDKGVIKNVKFNLKSSDLSSNFFENKTNIHPFSFIINNKWLTFYFRINYEKFISDGIKKFFELPKKQNNTEYKIYIKNKEDVIKLIDLIFVKKLKIKIYDFDNIIYPEHNEIIKSFENDKKINNQTIETVKKVLTNYRTGQQKYRNELLEKWNYRCSVTGINQVQILKASHIKPFSESNESEKYDIENGLLLSPNLDSLFDLHLISFNENGNIMLTNSITTETYKTLGIDLNMSLRFITDGTSKYLTIHRAIFENLN